MTQSRDISNFREMDAKLQMVIHHPAKFETGRSNGSLKQANQKNGRRKKKKILILTAPLFTIKISKNTYQNSQKRYKCV